MEMENTKYTASAKFHYLGEAMEAGTRAARVVSSYPRSTENYPKVIEALQERFGDKSVLSELYVRQLLKLVVKNSTGGKKDDLDQLYDSIESHLHNLESLKRMAHEERKSKASTCEICVQTQSCLEKGQCVGCGKKCIDNDSAAVFLYPLVESSLPTDVLKDWQQSPLSGYSGDEDKSPQQRMEDLRKFLKVAVKGVERMEVVQEGVVEKEFQKKASNPHKFRSADKVPTAASLTITTTKACVFCEKTNHSSLDCFRTNDLLLKEKKQKIRDKGACYNCIRVSPPHLAKNCTAKPKCDFCDSGHYRCLCPHMDKKVLEKREASKNKAVTAASASNSFGNGEVQKSVQVVNRSQVPLRTQKVQLPTLHVNVKNGERRKEVRLLFDRGSMKSYIKSSTAKEMKCKRVCEERVKSSVFGGMVTEVKFRSLYEVELEAIVGKFAVSIHLTDEPIICNDIHPIPYGPWIKDFMRRGVNFTDTYCEEPDIEILIGSDLEYLFRTGKEVTVAELTAVETRFGWTLHGPLKDDPSTTVTSASPLVTLLLAQEKNFPDLWSLETLGIKDSAEVISRQEHESQVKSRFLKEIKREEDGRYEVALPWVSEPVYLPTNGIIAKQRLDRTVAKMSEKNYCNYDQIFRDWEAKGIIETVDMEPDVTTTGHFIPHRAVLKPLSKTTPIRPVFDASARSKGFPSLNQCLEKGPNLLELIPDILTRFRTKRVGVTADIRKAFQMIKVKAKDRNYQKFLWFQDMETKVLKVYRHCRVIFGMNCSPFILEAVLEHHLNQVPEQDKSLAQFLLKSLYMDNVVAALETEEEYELFKNKSVDLLAEAQFELRQWESNCDPEGEETTTGILGLKWHKTCDTLSLHNMNLKTPVAVTKRTVLSQIASIFDPMGIASPAILPAKLLLQSVWKEPWKWDDPWPEDKAKQYLMWRSELPWLEKIAVPRHIFGARGDQVQLHTFCDSSEDAFTANVFVRVKNEKGVKVQLHFSKIRLAPLKNKKNKISISRLELLGALIGARLVSSVQKSSEQKYESILWTDSTTVLAWLARDADWGTFVGNRVREINSLTSITQWRHVPGAMNPADLPSRVCGPSKLLESCWWEGPKWLLRPEEEWPQNKSPGVNEEEVEMERKKITVTTVTLLAKPTKTEEIRVSQFRKFVRSRAWVLRYLNELKKKKRPSPRIPIKLNSMVWSQIPPLSDAEERKAELLCLRQVQHESFTFDPRGELDTIGGVVVERSGDGIIRLKTKLNFGEDLTADFKSPILLPKGHPVVQALIRYVHLQSNHAGVGIVGQILREKYWILQSRRSVKKVLEKCVRCLRHKGKNYKTEVASLPPDRVKTGAPFQTTGVDLFGPLYLRNGGKVWVVIFTCAVYRCLLLDIVEDISTEKFLNALIRFISDQGRPYTVFSDQGTNLVGSSNLLKLLDWKEVQDSSTQKHIRWVLNPPTSAWYGGWWERLIRCVKDCLKRELGKARLERDELQTLLRSVAATINDRPLTALTEDPEDLRPLTPRMFMSLIPNAKLPDFPVVSKRLLSSAFYQMQNIKKLLDHRFMKEYLGQLVHHHHNDPKVPKEGDLVFVGEDNKKRNEWRLGRVVKVIPGRDGKVRVTEVRTQAGLLTRDAKRLYPLEVSDPDEVHFDVTPVPTTGKGSDAEDDTMVTRSGRPVKKPARYGSWVYGKQ